MYKIGENIHIVSPKVKQALAERDGAFFVELAKKQQSAGADSNSSQSRGARGRPAPRAYGGNWEKPNRRASSLRALCSNAVAWRAGRPPKGA